MALEKLKKASPRFVAFDIETNGVNESKCRVIGIAWCYDFDEGFYLPLAEWNKETKTLDDLFSKKLEDALVAKLCSNLSTSELLMHNGVFDIACMFHSYRIDLTPHIYHDTMLAKHTIDEEHPFGLKDLGEIYIGEDAKDEQLDLAESVKANGGRWTKTEKDIYMGDLDLIAKYAIKDVILTAKLFDLFDEELSRQDLSEFYYKQEVMPLYKRATIPMKLGGIFSDVDYFKKLEKEVENDILSLTDEVLQELGEIIEPKVHEILDDAIPSSRTGQFAEGVLRHYNLPVPINRKTGKPTLAKGALRSLISEYPDHPALQWLIYDPPMISTEVVKEFPILDESGVETGEYEERTVTKLIPDPNIAGPSLPSEVVYEVKRDIYVSKHPDNPSIFNLSSNHHLSWLLFTAYGETPKSHSKKTGKPQVNKDSLGDYEHLPFIKKFLELKRLEKLVSTYIKPILDKQNDGWIYPSMQQWGTTSGRYSCGGGLNLQTLPRFERPKRCLNKKCESKKAKIRNVALTKIHIDCSECGSHFEVYDAAAIKRGFIAPPGYKIVNADFSALEPRIFAWVSGDNGLKEVYWDGLDLYSKIAIDVFGLKGVSARETDENYLKKVNPDARQQAKVFTLAVPYGANAGRISGLMKKEFKEAQDIIDAYLDAYPGLKDYMSRQEEDAKYNGCTSTNFGRVRHLPHAKELFDKYSTRLYNKKSMQQRCGEKEGSEIYYEFRNLLNNAKNFPIQATAAHVTNASLIMLADLFDENEIDGWISLQVHDEITCIVRDDQADLASKLLQKSMEENWVAKEIDVPMIGVPQIAVNLAEAK